ncbi:hypothetical protein CWATWH0402_5663 [Crocosphaera watsonii WH 0402]|uniref:Uncharacterized protein n=2 Tax=Crocosphaera watsonii TaxID=263511 RepID=T2JJZ0_CROWT|nr:hypothetical protein [Crocosphaera watsonii]CCQ64797.1 hypothetical protein CWATWH0402_5663 [Crocosphaera watsonii WH 0402]
MLKTSISWLLASSIVVVPSLTASSVAESNVAESKLKLWKVTYEYCVSEAAALAHSDQWPDQPLLNTKDGRCVRSYKPLYVYAEKKPEVGFLHHIGSQIRSSERFKRDRYYAAFKGNGCVGQPVSEFGWYSADNIFSIHGTYSNQTPIIDVPTQAEEIQPSELPNLSNNSTRVIPSYRGPCNYLIPVQAPLNPSN